MTDGKLESDCIFAGIWPGTNPVFGGIELLITICLFGVGYAGYMDPGFFALPALAARSAPAPADPTDRQVEKPDFSRFDDRLSVERLQRYFSDKQPYTQPGLSLEEVAGALHLPARYISYLINTHCDTNFNGYVNRYRMADVLGKLTDPKEQHKTILALAFEAGFSSKSTFNHVFKQHTGQSPSQFLQSQKQVPTTTDAHQNPDNKS